MMEPKRWFNGMRHYVYERLFDIFGPVTEWDGWEGKTPYPNGKKHIYWSLMGDLANHFNKKYKIKPDKEYTLKSVDQQVKWGITRCKAGVHHAQFAVWAMNIVAAYEVGLLPACMLPDFTLLDYDKHEVVVEAVA